VNWRYETWRKLYVREEGSFAALSYSARAAAAMLLKLCDDRGRIYPRRGEGVVESVCFRLGADRGERRMVRKAIAELVADGYLAQGEGWLRIRNFHLAQGRPGDAEPVANVSRPSVDHAASETRTSVEPVANGSPMSTEECVKSPEPLAPVSDVPSGSSEPAMTAEQAARARDPKVPLEVGPGWVRVAPVLLPRDPVHHEQMRRIVEDPPRAAAQTDPPSPQPRSIRPGGVTAQRLLDTFGRLRGDILPNALPWQAAGRALFDKAQGMAITFDDHPEAAADIDATMRMVLERARESQDPKDGEVNYAFGVWVARFTNLREQLHGLRRGPDDGGKDCPFHEGAKNSGRRAPKHLQSRACPECRHLDARAGPRPAARPESIGDLVAAQGER
jgi:hypothetical protein